MLKIGEDRMGEAGEDALLSLLTSRDVAPVDPREDIGVLIGFSKNSPEYPFQIVDPTTMITIPIRKITAPPGWPKGEPTSTYTWIDKTWPKVTRT